ncbi:unnamed protein product [Notodromas monacha]|uniref:Mannosyltransferase n=1 Tax=Notodromas monacha TaxID=399045 RepID=A0A7R9BE73_9CRUS|nr:unnamed protein product [Notodromas monacha]CAG0913032.1 unnamed protein product [Notodromas monacha]
MAPRGLRKRREIRSPEATVQHLRNHGFKEGDGEWAPGCFAAFKVLVSIRLASAVWNGIADCDETYNYWEPAHFLIYGFGFQTWEYSPEYALRSYAYVALHAFPGLCYAWLIQWNPMLVFFFLRCVLGFACALCEVYFYSGIKERFGARCGRMTLGLLLSSAGMFHAATAFLPSSFSMYLTMLAMGAWFNGLYELAVVSVAISALLGWPFAAILGIPIAVDVLLRKQLIWRFTKASVISLLVILAPMTNLDSYMYGKLVIASWNIIKYNVLGSGSELYGVEPLSFYVLNGFLNMNIAFLAALVALPIVTFERTFQGPKKDTQALPVWLALMGMYLWILIFFSQPHKEERFLFPIYPLICLAASMTVESALNLASDLINRHLSDFKTIKVKAVEGIKWFPVAFLLVSTLLSVSRVAAVYKGYHGALEVYMEMGELARGERAEKNVVDLSAERNTTLCLGKEWHRFPSSFFLPSRKWRVEFLHSEFRGLLPKHYEAGINATSIIPTGMNDRNQEEESRYVDESACDLIIDYDPSGDDDCGSAREPCYSRDLSTWIKLHSAPFLDAPKSSKLFRSFYVPYLSDRKCTFGSYDLLGRRINKRRSS